MPALAFFFDLCRLVIENVKIKCEDHHLKLQTLLVTFDANPNADVMTLCVNKA